jgi:hypothetical protein
MAERLEDEDRPVFVDSTGRRKTVVHTLSACLVVALATVAFVITTTVLGPTAPWPSP